MSWYQTIQRIRISDDAVDITVLYDNGSIFWPKFFHFDFSDLEGLSKEDSDTILASFLGYLQNLEETKLGLREEIFNGG